MANSVDSIKKIDKEIEVVISSLKKVSKEVTDISSLAREMSNAFTSVKTPNNLNDTLKTSKDNTEQLNALIKEQNSLERKLISTIAKKTLAQESTSKAVAKENEELKILRREQRNQLKQVSELSNAYEKVNAQLNLQIREYQGLSVSQKKGAKLTDIQKKRFDELAKSIKTNQQLLKSTDAEVGRFTRNVGNYSSGFDTLGNSLAQLTREAPAFAVSAQTGFLALSNNIPILADEIQKLSVANKKLAADGKATKSVFSQVAKSFFGFQTLLSLGVLLVTLYGDKIVDFVGKLIKGAKGFDAIKDSQKAYNESVKEGIKNSVSEISQMQLLLKFSADTTKSMKSRNKAVDKLIRSSGGLIKKQDRLNILNGDALDIEKKLTKSILNRAIIQQLQTKIGEDLNKVIDNNLKIQENQRKSNEALDDAETKRIQYLEAAEYLEAKRVKISKDTTLTQDEKIKRWRELEVLIRQNDVNISKYNASNQKSASIESENIKLIKERDEAQSKINELIKSALKLTNDYTLELDDNANSLSKLNKATAIYLLSTEERLKKTLAQGEKLSKLFNDLFKDDIDIKFGEIDQASLSKALEDINSLTTEQLKSIFDDDLFKEGLNDLAGTIEEFTGVSGAKFLDFFDKITEKGIDSFEEIGDIAASAFSLAADVSNSFFQGRIDGYQADIDASNEYYDNLLQNEELSDQERDRLEKDRKAKEDKLKKEQANEKKKQFETNKAFKIGETIVNTAAAVAEALPNIPLSIAVGILGAAQLGVIASQPVPKFAEGGVMDKDGLMMINDHRSGRLEVVERDGKLLMTDQKNAIVEGKRGDIIHKDAKEYFSNLSDKDILKDVNNHAIMATLQNQNYLINKLDNKRVVDAQKVNTDRIIKAIKGQKTKFNVHQNISLADDLKHLNRLNDTL